MNKKYSMGFTLVEMLIVIVIIGILAAALIPRLTGAQNQARDAARSADINQIGTALTVYNADNGSYPAVSTPTYNATTALSSLVGLYIKALPTDPQSNTSVGFCSLDTTGTTTTASYGYILLANSTNFALAANTQVPKKGNRIPATSGTGCITGGTTFSTVNSNIVKGSVITTQGTTYIYSN